MDKENEITELIYYTKDEIEHILTDTNAIDIEQLEDYLADWVKQTCFNRKEINHVHDYWKNLWGYNVYIKDRDYVVLTYEEFNKKYSKILNIQLVENPNGWLSIPIEKINEWEEKQIVYISM